MRIEIKTGKEIEFERLEHSIILSKGELIQEQEINYYYDTKQWVCFNNLIKLLDKDILSWKKEIEKNELDEDSFENGCVLALTMLKRDLYASKREIKK